MKFHYVYDFGDDWEHTLFVEKILDRDKTKLPVCIDGARACPPEDCGGIWSYDNLLKALTDKKHPEHKELKEWVGGKFDSEHFDLKKVNRLVKDY